MTKTWMLLLLLSGCAASNPMRRASMTLCSVGDPAWPSAPRDWDRATTLDVLGTLSQATDDDRARLHAGHLDEVGALLDAAPAPSRAFIAHDVAELGTRLRQLDCAVRARTLPFDVADRRYAQILGELRVERSVLAPGS